MAVTIIVGVLIAIWLIINIRKMVLNVKQGKSIDGCDGHCEHCTSCAHGNGTPKAKKSKN